MSAPYALESIIAAVAPRLDPALVCRDNVNDFLAIARCLKRWQCTGFECRLGSRAPRADFGIHLTREDGIPTDLGGLTGAEPGGAESLEVWRRLHQFSKVWNDTESLLSQTIPSISLEFDLHRPSSTLMAPSVFFSIHPARCEAETLATRTAVDIFSLVVRALLELLGVDVSDGVEKKLEECFKVLVPQVPFLQFGVWLARSTDSFRICAPSVSFSEIQRIVGNLQWQGPADAYESQWRNLLQFGGKGSLHLDIAEEASAKLGIEVPFGEDSACIDTEDPESTRFFDYLVDKNWCLPEKRDAVLSWVGGFRLSTDRNTGSEEAASIFLRTISHVKMVFQPEQAPAAKVYLGIGRLPPFPHSPGSIL